MPSLRSRVIRWLIVERVMRRVISLEGRTLDGYRREYTGLARHQILPRGTRVEKASVDGLPAEWVRARKVDDADRRTILYFHGGGYVSGSCSTHRDMASRISAACGVRTLVVDYRLAPEHKYPAALEDARRSLRWLIGQGVSPEEIVIAGDSAGGGLALTTLLDLRDAGAKLPKAAFLLSPWLDLEGVGESHRSRAQLDPFISEAFVRACAEAYLGGVAAVSALERDLTGLPDLLVQVGDHELLLSDSVQLAERARAAGVEVELEIWDEMWHVFQGFAVILPEAKRALAAIGRFVREKLE